MRIGINLTDLIPGRIGGMENYMRSLVHYFPKIENDAYYAIGYKDILNKIDLNGCIAVPIKPSASRQSQSKLLRELIVESKLDIWLSPLLVLDPLDCPIPSAVTIPDMQHKYFPEFFDKNTLDWREEYYQKSVDNADVVFTLSNSSRQDIIRFLDVNPAKVKAIYLDSPEWFNRNIPPRRIKQVKDLYKLPKNFLYYPANTWPHKNHLRLMEAYLRIKDKIPLTHLLFSGYQHHASSEITKFIKKNNLRNRVHFIGYVKTDDIQSIYKNALGLIFPSLFEGFGIPIIEAFRSGCPVLCANNTSIPEVAGNAALYFDALSISSIADAIATFTKDQDLRLKLITAGEIQAKKFSYEKTAHKTLNYLKEIAIKKTGMRNKKTTWPKISIITPSFNQGKYIERTIKSVLKQNYPNLEYIVMDGGSIDNTLRILKKYSKKLKYISENDKGQTDAINKGLKMSTGEIIAYLNSDDTYEPDALKKIAIFFINNPKAKFVYGKGRHIGENDEFIEDYPSEPTDYLRLHPTCAICQPTAFWRRDLIDELGYFDAELKYAMDYDYWIRISEKYPLNFLYEYLGNTRFYKDTKTSGQRPKVHREIIDVQKKHYSKVHANWILAYVHAKLEKNDRSTIYKNTTFLITLILGSLYGFIKFNHELPPLIVWKYYLIWTKEIFAFMKRKAYQTA